MEKKMSYPNKMEVNAAIEKLLAQDDAEGEAARVIVRYGHSLKKSRFFTLEDTSTKVSDATPVSGYTPELGHVEIHDGEKVETIERTWGVYKDRVGYFRLWKVREGTLSFHHFWKSSAATANADGALPDVYYLFYNPKTLEPECFGIQKTRIIFQIGSTFTFSKLFLEPIYGHKNDANLGWHLGHHRN